MNLKLILFAVLFLQIGCFVNGENTCPTRDVTFYYVNGGILQGTHYESGANDKDLELPIPSTETEIKSLAYDSSHGEFYYVSKGAPDTIVGFSQAVKNHTVIYWPKANFSSIVVDQTTKNIYFTEDGLGIGVCSGHVNDTKCAMLVEESDNTAIYSNLILHSERGLMFWLQSNADNTKTVKMASMDGKHIRSLDGLGNVQGMTLDGEVGSDYLYVARGDQIFFFNLRNHVIEHLVDYTARHLLLINCHLHSFEGYNNPIIRSVYESNNKDKMYRNSASVLVLDNENDKITNPCEKFVCNGTCVLKESNSDPISVCILSTNNAHPSDKDEKMDTKEIIETLRYRPINGFLLFFTIMFFILVTALILIHTNLWANLQLIIRARTNNCRGFENPAASMSFKSALSADLP